MKLTKQEKSERNRLVWALAMALHRSIGEEARRASQQAAFANGTWRPAWWASTGAELLDQSGEPPGHPLPGQAAGSIVADACSEDLAGVAE